MRIVLQREFSAELLGFELLGGRGIFVKLYHSFWQVECRGLVEYDFLGKDG